MTIGISEGGEDPLRDRDHADRPASGQDDETEMEIVVQSSRSAEPPRLVTNVSVESGSSHGTALLQAGR